MSEPKLPGSRANWASDAPIISVRDLVVRYGDKTVLDGVNLDIFSGETMVIMGGSGSGKSTLLRRIMGIDKPTSGHVFIKNVDIACSSEEEVNNIRRIMGISFQSAALFNSMTLADNVALPLREHTNLAESTIRLMTRMKLSQVGLGDAENLYPAQLSGGMRSAFLIADRMCMLRHGKILAAGTTEEIRQSTHPRIRQFLDRVPDQAAGGQDDYLQTLTKIQDSS